MSVEDKRQAVVRQIPFTFNTSAMVQKLAVVCGASEGWCWLDGEADGGWSYLGAASEVRVAERGHEREFLSSLYTENEPKGNGFFGGWVLSLGYEFGVALLGLEPEPDEAAPGFALRIDTVLAVNEAEGRAELRGPSEAALDAWLLRFVGVLGAGAYESRPVKRTEPDTYEGDVTSRKFLQHDDGWRHTDTVYRAQIERAKLAIAEGDAYVLCLTDTATLRGEFDPLELYLRLREHGAAIRGGVIVTGDRALVSASPERFLSVQGGTVATHPIKGTRPRGSDPASDRDYADELANDPKELAENLMIVDLMRNDLSRVCMPKSVRVDDFRRVETHPHVHQLVSTVSGELQAGLSACDVILACFPGDL
ncbi:anthranilate synthase component I family protein [Leucobacter coleopterorum]|uniref:Anthranilate synthase component I family protein n=1 Tax=Leucobacter coleopterorum TaxID=2714933 RepID=A0ABX6K028_9MICO|nr:chorismate-binding protein [Leucobacter coleopterorum]QIM18559.1 anthranilate synthase component I family protein [Leucobacter coleopterorum]